MADQVQPTVAALLGDFLSWWARQMSSFLPPGVAGGLGQPDALLVSANVASDPPYLRLSVRRRQRETPLGQFRMDESGRQSARAAIHNRIRRVILRPNPATVLERKIELPLATEPDLRNVLCYEMDRLTPFTAEQVFWAARIDHRDRTRARLELSLSLIPKVLVQPALVALEAMGLRASAIETTGRDGSRRIIDLVDGQAPSQRWFGMACGVVLLLVVGAAATPFVLQARARAAVEAGIANLRPQVAEADKLRRRIAAGSAGSDVIAAEHAAIGDALQVLAVLTDLFPDNTVLTDLSLRKGKITITGQSPAAPQLIPAMAAEPMLHNPSFAAPVTRTPDGKADTFVIRVGLDS